VLAARRLDVHVSAHPTFRGAHVLPFLASAARTVALPAAGPLASVLLPALAYVLMRRELSISVSVR